MSTRASFVCVMFVLVAVMARQHHELWSRWLAAPLACEWRAALDDQHMRVEPVDARAVEPHPACGRLSVYARIP